CKPQPAAVRLEPGEGVHSVEAPQELHPILGEPAQQYLRVGASGENLTRPGERPTVRLVIVDLAVERDGSAATDPHRLRRRVRHIDDRQTPVTQPDLPLEHLALAVRTPMGQDLQRVAEGLGRAVSEDRAYESAHWNPTYPSE